MIGETLGKYEITEHLGHGGMAEVYKAYQPSLDRHVAIKVLHAFLADEENFLTRFEREAQAVAGLRHPSIVRVYDFDYDEDRNVYYMVMEFIDGPSLEAKLEDLSSRGEAPSLHEAIRIVTAIGEALNYAHQRDMIHRDIKPGNIMFNSDGEVILTDFGIAKMIDRQKLTASGAMVGTPAYISPELAEGRPVDARSDIYSLGVVLYQLATGTLPFDADTPIGIILKHIREPLPSPRSVQPNLPAELEQVIVKALAKDPSQRYQTAEELTEDLRQVAEEQEIHLPPPATSIEAKPAVEQTASITPAQPQETTPPGPSPLPTPIPTSRQHTGWVVAAAGALITLVLLGTVGVLLSTGRLNNTLSSLTDIGATVEATPTPNLDATEIAATVIALQATVGAPTSTPSSTPVPTPTSTPTPDLTSTALANCVFDAEVIAERTIGPQVLMPGERFVRRWTVKNVGTCAWPDGVELVFAFGDKPNAAELPSVEPPAAGEITEIQITLRAPSAYGLYRSAWQLQSSDGDPIGDELEISYRVGPPPTPQPTATPTATPTPALPPTPYEPLWMSIPGLVECNRDIGGVITWGAGGGPSEERRYFYSQVAPAYELEGPYREFSGFPHVVTYFTVSGELTFPIPEECGRGDYGECGGPGDGFEIVWKKVAYTEADCPQ